MLVRLGESVKPHEQRVGPLPDSAIEGRPQILRRSHIQKLRLDTQGSGRPLDLFPLRRNSRITHIEEGRDPCDSWKQFPEQFDPFWV